MKVKKQYWVLFFLLGSSLALMLFFGSRKEGYHVDEIYSYGLANSEYLPFMHFGESGYDVKDWMMEYGAGESFTDLCSNLLKDYKILKECGFRWQDSVIYRDYLTAKANSADTRTTTWVSGKEYRNYIAVSPSNTFNYASVYYNQRGDVHPPLFYILLHTVCSFFQGIFSPWFCLGLNILLMFLTLMVLYRMTERYLGGSLIALTVVGVYGLSCGLMTTALYLRMYALMTFMVVADCAVHLKIVSENGQMKRKNGILLMLVTLGGYLTHYYFVLYAIGIAAVFMCLMAFRRRWGCLIRYLLILAVSAVTGLCVWPFAIKHVFAGYRGNEAISILQSGEVSFQKIQIMLDQITSQILGGKSWFLLLAGILLAVFCIWKRKKEIPWAKVFLLVVPIVFYIVTVSQIVPFYAERYVMCMFPLLTVCLIAGFAFVVRKSFKKSWQEPGILLVGILFLLLGNCFVNTPNYLYPGGQETVVLPENTDCVYVLSDGNWNASAADSTILAQCRKVAVAYRSDLVKLKDTYHYRSGDTVMVAIQKELETEDVLREVRGILQVEKLTEIERKEGTVATIIFLTDNKSGFSGSE